MLNITDVGMTQKSLHHQGTLATTQQPGQTWIVLEEESTLPSTTIICFGEIKQVFVSQLFIC